MMERSARHTGRTVTRLGRTGEARGDVLEVPGGGTDPDPTGPDPTGPDPTGQLREVLDALAASVPASSGAYSRQLTSWRRRERRRRLILAVVATVVFAVADIIGLWALTRAEPGGHVIFDDKAPNTSPAARPNPGPP